MNEYSLKNKLKSISTYEKLKVRLRFFGPYELLEANEAHFIENEGGFDPIIEKALHENKKKRFNGALLYGPVKDSVNNKIRAWIRGRRVRSMVINEILRLYSLFENHKIMVDQNFRICQGLSDRADQSNDKKDHYRHAPLYEVVTDVECTPENPCDLCLIRKHVIFASSANNDKTFDSINDLAGEREEVRHFCGGERNKTESVFHIYKGNPNRCSDYYLTITLDTQKISIEKNRGIIDSPRDRVLKLLAIGLASINVTAAAPCRYDIINNDIPLFHNKLIESFIKMESLPADMAPRVETVSDRKPNQEAAPGTVEKDIDATHDQAQETIIKKTARLIMETLKFHGKSSRFQDMGSYIQSLGNREPEALFLVPEKNIKTGDEQLWGLKAAGEGKSIKSILIEHSEPMRDQTSMWREFFEQTSAILIAKALTEERFVKEKRRENIYYAVPDKKPVSLNEIPRVPLSPDMTDFIITGWLESETPFFFGSGKEDGTNIMPLIRNSDNDFFISYRALRLAIRADLKQFSQGCNYELNEYCTCDVCETLRRITVIDCVNTTFNLAQFRQRIRVHHKSCTADDGALFFQENGPQNLRFPFIMWYTANAKSMEGNLKNVLGKWKNGHLILGGSTSTKGRFRLIDPQMFMLDLSLREADNTPCIESLKLELKNRNFMGMDKQKIEKILTNRLSPCFLPAPQDDGITEIDISFIFDGPVISNDPVEAALNPDSPDAMPFRKLVVKKDPDGVEKPVYIYCLKGEGLKGLFLWLMGKHTGLLEKHDNHMGDTCFLCTVFGSEFAGAGIIRVEDADLIKGPGDLVRNDFIKKSWNQDVVLGAKFDHMVISGKDDHYLLFRTKIMIMQSPSTKLKESLLTLFSDLLMNMGTVGGKGRWGFGWVSGICFHHAPKWIAEHYPLGKIHRNVRYPQLVTHQPENPGQMPHRASRNPEQTPIAKYMVGTHQDQKIFNPYYYIRPDKTVDRRQKQVDHDAYHSGRHSGKIVIELETVSPFFHPDTNDSYAYDVSTATFSDSEAERLKNYCKHDKRAELIHKLDQNHNIIPVSWAQSMKDQIGEDAFQFILKNAHKSYRFKRRGKKLQFSGSLTSGAIANIHQILYNGCFRNLDQNRFVSRRLSADSAKGIRLGRVVTWNNETWIIECKSCRLPMYDNKTKTDSLSTSIPATKPLNDVISRAAETNKNYLMTIDESLRKQILKGEEIVRFNTENVSRHDKIATLHDGGYFQGYIKFTNINNPQKRNIDPGTNSSFNALGGYALDIELDSEPADKPIKQFTIGNQEITLTKRCERIGIWPDEYGKAMDDEVMYNLIINSKAFHISYMEKIFYETIVEEYEDYKDRLPEPVRTIIANEKLKDGAMVWFREHESGNNQAVNITPVTISRAIDKAKLLDRFPVGYEDLKPCVRECGDHCGSDYPECIVTCMKDIHQNPCTTCGIWGTPYYKGRVYFGIAELISDDGNALWYKPDGEPFPADQGVCTTIVEQHSPRDTWPLGDQAAKLPGRKIYVNHPPGTRPASTNSRSKNNISAEILASGNRFRQEITFHNFSDDEMTRFLYCLVLENDMAHRLGYGCNLGMGSVKIHVKSILVREPNGGYVQKTSDFMEKVPHFGSPDKPEWYNSIQAEDLRDALWIPPADENVTISYLNDIEGHEQFKEIHKWYGIQAILTVPFHPCHARARKNQRAEAYIDSLREEGTVFKVNGLKGWIIRENNTDVFVEFSRQAPLHNDDRVSFIVSMNENGPYATEVKVL